MWNIWLSCGEICLTRWFWQRCEAMEHISHVNKQMQTRSWHHQASKTFTTSTASQFKGEKNEWKMLIIQLFPDVLLASGYFYSGIRCGVSACVSFRRGYDGHIQHPPGSTAASSTAGHELIHIKCVDTAGEETWSKHAVRLTRKKN